jgi:hypothetical protein
MMNSGMAPNLSTVRYNRDVLRCRNIITYTLDGKTSNEYERGFILAFSPLDHCTFGLDYFVVVQVSDKNKNSIAGGAE